MGWAGGLVVGFGGGYANLIEFDIGDRIVTEMARSARIELGQYKRLAVG